MIRNGIIYSGLLTVLLLSVLLSVSFGAIKIEFQTIWHVVFNKIFNISVQSNDDNYGVEAIILFHRFPRALLACIVGIGLSMTGVILQAVVRNPLADPQLLGVSSGASVGAVFAIMMGINWFGNISVPLFAFGGGLLSFILVLSIANYKGKLTPLRLILAGISVSYLCSSITSYLSIKTRNVAELKSIQFWLLGGVSGAKWDQLLMISIVILTILLIFMFFPRYLNVISLGDDTAKTLGVNISLFRKVSIILSALIVAITVSICGAIGFVGLIVPHTVRIIFGANHRRVLPISVLIGGIFMVLCDLLSRVLIAPEELPIGIITAFVGSPFFIWLMLRSQKDLA